MQTNQPIEDVIDKIFSAGEAVDQLGNADKLKLGAQLSLTAEKSSNPTVSALLRAFIDYTRSTL
jgi:hypothetical protein